MRQSWAVFDAEKRIIFGRCPWCGEKESREVPAHIRIIRGAALIVTCQKTGRKYRFVVGTVTRHE